jgi:hypothetical protein
MISVAAASFRPTMMICALPFRHLAKDSTSPCPMPEVPPTNTATGAPLKLATSAAVLSRVMARLYFIEFLWKLTAKAMAISITLLLLQVERVT